MLLNPLLLEDNATTNTKVHLITKKLQTIKGPCESYKLIK